MTKKTLADYLLNAKKDYKYTIRVAVEDISSQDISRIENNLKAYDLIDVSKPKKTIFQKTPYGFAEPMNSEVVIFDVTTSLPASCFYLAREIAKILKISEIRVVVNGLDNPTPELNVDEVKKISDDDNIDVSELYGDEYNKNMLKTIMDAKKKDSASIDNSYNSKK